LTREWFQPRRRRRKAIPTTAVVSLRRHAPRLIRFLSLAIMACAELYRTLFVPIHQPTTRTSGGSARPSVWRTFPWYYRPRAPGRQPDDIIRCRRRASSDAGRAARAVSLAAHAREQLASLARTTQAREEAPLLRRRLMASESTTCLVVHAELHVPLLHLWTASSILLQSTKRHPDLFAQLGHVVAGLLDLSQISRG
jgi:hypothetical protein